jgi:hypothetical protein
MQNGTFDDGGSLICPHGYGASLVEIAFEMLDSLLQRRDSQNRVLPDLVQVLERLLSHIRLHSKSFLINIFIKSLYLILYRVVSPHPSGF